MVLARAASRNAFDAELIALLRDAFTALSGDPSVRVVVLEGEGKTFCGGAGLCAVADAVVAEENTVFGFTETKLGIIPAVISPFVLPKIGVSHARRLFLTGERFDTLRAQAIGLVHEVVHADALDGTVDAIAAELATAGPSAIAAAKALIPAVRAASYEDSRALTARAIAKQRTSEEGQEGLRAFLERRAASWAAR